MSRPRRSTTAPKPAPELGLRRSPQQERARETVEHILASAAALLAEVGIDGFNTNLLAKRAGVKVPTVYRYFPNKLAVIRELARRMTQAWDGWFDDELIANPSTDLRETWSSFVNRFASGVAEWPGGLAIRAALHSLPDLKEIEAEDTRRLTSRLSKALRRRTPALEPRRAQVASMLLLETAIAALDAAFSGPTHRRRSLLDELVEMQVVYLEHLLAS
jgi:AcrR family transcriptional regulator